MALMEAPVVAQEIAPSVNAVWIALIGSLTSIAVLIITQLYALRKQGDTQASKLDGIAAVGVSTHDLANNNLAEQRNRADRADARITEMHKEIADLKELLTAADLSVGRARKATKKAKAKR